ADLAGSFLFDSQSDEKIFDTGWEDTNYDGMRGRRFSNQPGCNILATWEEAVETAMISTRFKRTPQLIVVLIQHAHLSEPFYMSKIFLDILVIFC
ncbi:MAG TPA: hypothetical protein VGD14_08920, partial [bacterium]